MKLLDDKLQSLNNLILINLDIKFLIQIMYGRILTIVSNNQLLNNQTILVEVTVDLGPESPYLPLRCVPSFSVGKQ